MLKLVALLCATYFSIRARFYPGIGAIVSMGYLTLARVASMLHSNPSLPLRHALEQTWWLYPCAMLVLSLGPMLFAFSTFRELGDEEPLKARLRRVGFAFLANTLLDASLLVIVVVLVLAARDT